MTKNRIEDENLEINHTPNSTEVVEEISDSVKANNDDEESQDVRLGQVHFPGQGMGEEIGPEEYEFNLAQQAGRFNDEVILGSPASEYGATGRGALKDIIKASEERLSEKLNNSKNE
ncbi:hypothetical protein [Selenihalanaerobacter shriftii]|uniref:Uncharacterized protein n=1 Tax=Selenihalanaerobacter shriftii TaxID=142842 RepID=A0A1T4Q1S2_9FIRM|nr:hypothetical protein [Selenihalanaerobacter shriftii]SJZ97168.1 hypothetical protein SAMN02745118_02377 [Selenihalanaerobacter shriftii]